MAVQRSVNRFWSAINGDPGIDYVPIIEMLIDRGAVIPPGALDWLADQESGSALNI